MLGTQIIVFFVVAGVILIDFGLTQYCFVLTSKANLLICVYYIPLFFQFTQGDSATQGAVAILPLIFLLVAAMITSGTLMSKTGRYREWYIGGSALYLIGGAVLSKLNPSTSKGVIYGMILLIGAGVGSHLQASAWLKHPMNRTTFPMPRDFCCWRNWGLLCLLYPLEALYSSIEH